MKIKHYGILHIPSGNILYSAWGEEYIISVVNSLGTYLLINKPKTLQIEIILEKLSYHPVIEEFEICELDDV